MRIFIFIFLLSLTLQAKAQNLQGKIIDETSGEGIPFVSIGVIGTNNATVTNENGEFILKVPAFPAKLRFSHVSYLTTEFELLANDEKLVIRLKPASITLEEVMIDPFKGQRMIKQALEKATITAGMNFYAKAFYRQLTKINDKPSQIYELFYDLKWNTKRVQGWLAKQSRYAELKEDNGFSFSLNNQSYLTFSFTGYLLPTKSGKFVSLETLDDYQITIEKYIEQADQKIAVVSCKYKNAKKNLFYVNSTYYIGEEDFKVYRLENSVFNLPMKFTSATPKYPPVVTTIASFSVSNSPVPVLESIATNMLLSLDFRGRQINTSTTSLLTVYELDNNLKNQEFEALDRKTSDKTVIESIVYDGDFWRNNPIVRQTTLENSFIKMMESKSAFGTMKNP
jgi:hypothetical protein